MQLLAKRTILDKRDIQSVNNREQSVVNYRSIDNFEEIS